MKGLAVSCPSLYVTDDLHAHQVSAIILRIGKGISHGDPVTSIPIEFRNSAFSNNTKGSYLPNSLPTGGLDHELEVGQAASRLRFDLTN